MIYLITGASRPNGIGAELVRQLLAAGHDVHATARSVDALAFLKHARFTPHALDVADEKSIAALGRAVSAVDVLVNNAGTIGNSDAAIGEQTQSALVETFVINAAGPVLVTQALLPALEKGKRKLVAHVTSRMGSIADNSSGGYYSYRMSKAALNMASMSLARDLAPRGITSIVLHPGWVKTDMGGSGAPTEAPESARGMLAVIDRVGLAESGKFYDFRGKELPF